MSIPAHSRQLISHLLGFLGPDALKERGTPEGPQWPAVERGGPYWEKTSMGVFTGF